MDLKTPWLWSEDGVNMTASAKIRIRAQRKQRLLLALLLLRGSSFVV